MKFFRSSKYQQLSFRDKSNQPFRFFLTQQTFSLLHNIDLHCGGGLSLPEEVTNQDTKDRYYVTSLIEESLTSSQLEGAVVTRSEAREMIRSNRKPSNEHEKMVLNNFRTMRQLASWKEHDLNLDLILEIHRSITLDTMDNPKDVGALRTSDDINVVDEESNEVLHTPPTWKELPERLTHLCKFANNLEIKGFLHPVIRSIILHFWLAYEHPFVGGNGRTARALFYWSMLKHDFWLFEFISISHEILKAPKQYYRAFLHTETDGGDLNYFLHHQLTVIVKAIQALQDYIEGQRKELDKLYQHLRPADNFNHRQLALLKNALKHPNARYTVTSHQQSHGISNQTARTDLQKLVDLQLFISRRMGKAITFFPHPNIRETLSQDE